VAFTLTAQHFQPWWTTMVILVKTGQFAMDLRRAFDTTFVKIRFFHKLETTFQLFGVKMFSPPPPLIHQWPRYLIY
jgi:hypothetical protein